MCLPKDIVLMGVDVARQCKECLKYELRMPKPGIKSNLATTFNEVVQQDLFFLWDENYIMMIDEAIKWKAASDQVPDKRTPALLRVMMFLWI